MNSELEIEKIAAKTPQRRVSHDEVLVKPDPDSKAEERKQLSKEFIFKMTRSEKRRQDSYKIDLD